MPPSRPARRALAILAAACLLAAGCATSLPTDADPKPKRSPAAKASADPAEKPGVVAPDTPADPAKGYFGRVLGLDGKAAAGVRIEARIIANHGGSLITDNGAGLITDNGAGLVSNNSGAYRLAAADEVLTTSTGPDGTFSLAIPAGQKANVEAIQAADVKAIRGQVGSDGGGFDLQLAPTGTLQGKVTTPADRQITNYQGVDVYIPGTSYLAKADAAGGFKIDDVPVGVYKLFAEKVGLGSGVSTAVTVKSRETVAVAELMLKIDPITIASVDPPFALPGTKVTVKGTRFGKSSGAIFKLRLGGLEIDGAQLVDDETATFVVPKNSAGGDLVVEVNGLKSEPKPYPAIAGFDATGPDADMAVGSTFQSVVTATDVDWEPIKDVTVPATFAVGEGDAVTVDAAGKITAVKPGSAIVHATYGGYRAEIEVFVSASGGVAASLGGATARAASQLSGVGVGPDGQIYVTTSGRVMKVGADGGMTTLAGGASGVDVKDAAGKLARFEAITGAGMDPAGRLLVADSFRIRAVGLADGMVTTIAGSRSFDSFADEPQDGLGTSAAVADARGVAMGPEGVAFFLDGDDLRRIGADGMVTTIDGAPSFEAIGLGADGKAYGVAARVAYRIAADGTTTPVSPLAAPASWPALGDAEGVARDPDGNLYVAYPSGIVRVAPDGTAALLAGAADDGQIDAAGTAARFAYIEGLAFQAGAGKGALIVVEQGAVRKVALGDAAPPVTTLVHGEVGSFPYSAEPIDDDEDEGGEDGEEDEDEDFADEEL